MTAVSNATPLMWVSYDGQVEVVKQMIDAGVDATLVNDAGRTALHFAAICDFRCEARAATCTVTAADYMTFAPRFALAPTVACVALMDNVSCHGSSEF